MQSTIEDILSHLKQVKPIAINKWQSLCPAHEDHVPSLSIAIGEDGKILMHCQAGCAFDAVCKSLGISESELFPDSKPPASKPQVVYDYKDEWGKLIYQVVRMPPKRFMQRRPGLKDEWIWNLDGVQRVLYRLPELIEADHKKYVFIVEGEKDCETLRKLGLVATTNSGGAGKWLDSYNRYLYGRKVIILPDNDGPGHTHAFAIAKSLLGRVTELRILFLDDLAVGGDVTDWLNTGGTIESLMLRVQKAKLQIGEGQALPVVKRLARVTKRDVAWLWANRFPMGKLSLLVGDPGLGKSFLSLYIAAQVSTGRPWPDIEEFIPIGSVIILSAEDDLEDTIAPRLDSAGADMEKIIALSGVMTTVDNGQAEQVSYFNLTKHLAALEKAVDDEPDCRLVIVDPLTAYMGVLDDHKNVAVRGVLMPLSDLAARKKIAVLGISHLNKSPNIRAAYRVIGSVAFVAAARATWIVARDQDDSLRRLFVPCKCNLSIEPTSLAFRIINNAVAFEPDPLQISADQALSPPMNNEEKTAIDEAIEWLQGALKNGKMKANDCLKQAKENNITEITLRRAAKKIKVIIEREGFGGFGTWIWKLPQ